MLKTTEAAKVDMITRISATHKKKRSHSRSRQLHVQHERESDISLKCEETMPPLPPNRGDDDEKRRDLVRAAQETALIRETARRFRKYARELSQKRIKNKDVASLKG